MAQQLMFDDITEQMDLPSFQKETSSRLSAQWAAASGDFDPIHYDKEYALNQKLPTMIINGRLKIAFLAQMINTFIGPSGRLRCLAVRHQGMDLVGDVITCKGKITRKYISQQEKLVDCEIWIETREGVRTATGSATFSLP